jgi:hypothetical protein
MPTARRQRRCFPLLWWLVVLFRVGVAGAGDKVRPGVAPRRVPGAKGEVG